MSSPQENLKRVRLNLKSFFSDYRRQSCIALKPNWTTIKDLIEHVEATFEISDVVILTFSGEYLPPKEPIDIISTDDKLWVVKSSEKDVPQPEDFEIVKTEKASGPAEIAKMKKRKRTHKRKLAADEKNTPVAIPKQPAKVAKTEIAGTTTKVSHVYFDDEGNEVESNPTLVKFLNFIDTLDALKPRIILANVKKSCALEESDACKNPKIEVPVATEIAAI